MTPAHYLIVKTDFAREAFVAKAIRRMGYDAIMPVECHAARVSRLTKAKKVVERPAIPRVLFAAIPGAAIGNLQTIRYYHSLQRDFAAQPLLIPIWQVRRFLDYLDDHNKMVRGNAHLHIPSPKLEPLVLKLDPANIPAVMDRLFGIREAA